MTTSTGSMDRVSRWFLSDDLYGDERERLRWYEGMAVAATIQWIAVPWAAAVLVWVLGRPTVLPLAIVMALMYLPTLLTGGYVRARRVETMAVRWTPKRVALGVLGGLPYLVFLVGALYPYDHSSDTMRGAVLGGVIGAGLAVGLVVQQARRIRAREAAAAVEDED
jgi:uncharacterized membrane protein YbaN (DUF454 family)